MRGLRNGKLVATKTASKKAAKPAPKTPGGKPQAKAEPVLGPEEAMMAMIGRTRGPLRFNYGAWGEPVSAANLYIAAASHQWLLFKRLASVRVAGSAIPFDTQGSPEP